MREIWGRKAVEHLMSPTTAELLRRKNLKIKILL